MTVAAKKRVIVFYSPPGNADPRACVDRNSKGTSAAAADAKCNIPINDRFRDLQRYRPVIRALERNKAVSFYDPVKFLCDDKKCLAADPPYILYADHGNLSEYGAHLCARSRAELSQLIFQRDLR